MLILYRILSFIFLFSDDAADEQSDGSTKDGPNNARVRKRIYEDGDVRGNE